MQHSEAFEFYDDQLPLKIHVLDKDGNEVDVIEVTDAGVLAIPSYPIEGRPYSVRIETSEVEEHDNRVARAYLHAGWAR